MAAAVILKTPCLVIDDFSRTLFGQQRYKLLWVNPEERVCSIRLDERVGCLWYIHSHNQTKELSPPLPCLWLCQHHNRYHHKRIGSHKGAYCLYIKSHNSTRMSSRTFGDRGSRPRWHCLHVRSATNDTPQNGRQWHCQE